MLASPTRQLIWPSLFTRLPLDPRTQCRVGWVFQHMYEHMHTIYMAQKDVRHQSSTHTAGRCIHPSSEKFKHQHTIPIYLHKRPDPLSSRFTLGFGVNKVRSTHPLFCTVKMRISDLHFLSDFFFPTCGMCLLN